MGFFQFLKQPDINQCIKEYQSTTGAILLDVRTPQEYREGHVPGSQNVSLQAIGKVASIVDNTDTPLFVYCHSGARSRQAVSFLERMGYSHVKNAGGIAAYSGKVER